MAIEYKCVGAPEKARRKKGAKTRSDRVAAAVQDILEAEAVDGWTYVRTDLIPVEERSGLFGRTHEVHRAVLVFQRNTESRSAPMTRPLAKPAAPTAPEETPIILAAGTSEGRG